MPPQVNPAGPGSKPIAIQTDNHVEPEEKNAQPQKESSNTTTPHRATPKEASNRKAELAAGGVLQQTALTGKLNANQSADEKSSTTASLTYGDFRDRAKKVIPETNTAAPGVLKAEAAGTIKKLHDEIANLERSLELGLLEFEAEKMEKQIEEKMRNLD